MSVNLPDKLKPSMAIAIDMLVNDPETKMKDVAEESGVAVSTLRRWLKTLSLLRCSTKSIWLHSVQSYQIYLIV